MLTQDWTELAIRKSFFIPYFKKGFYANFYSTRVKKLIFYVKKSDKESCQIPIRAGWGAPGYEQGLGA